VIGPFLPQPAWNVLWETGRFGLIIQTKSTATD
jgi:hypothetical protein